MSKDFRDTAGYADYLKEYTRKRLAEVWVPEFVNTGDLPKRTSVLDEDAFELCRSKKWVGAKGDTITAAGFKVAAAYLRR